jgi:tetratricopeptide (TPR) repeat protein
VAIQASPESGELRGRVRTGQGIRNGRDLLVRDALRSIADPPDVEGGHILLDRVTSTSSFDEALSHLGDIAPQLKPFGALIEIVPKLAYLPRYTLSGALQPPSEAWGGGITLTLDPQRGDNATDTLWAWSAESDIGTCQVLATGAAAWADFELRKRENILGVTWTESSESYAYTQAGLAMERRNRLTEALALYGRALAVDPMSVGAILNVANLKGRQGKYEEAADWLQYGCDVLGRKRTAEVRAEWKRKRERRGWKLRERVAKAYRAVRKWWRVHLAFSAKRKPSTSRRGHGEWRTEWYQVAYGLAAQQVNRAMADRARHKKGWLDEFKEPEKRARKLLLVTLHALDMLAQRKQWRWLRPIGWRW